MKMTKIRFIFQEPLTDDHKEILKVNLEAVKINAVNAMRKHILNKVGRFKVGQPVRDRLQLLGNAFELWTVAEFPNEKEVTFTFPNIDLTGQTFKVGDHTLGKIMPEKRLIRFIRNDVSKDMGIDRDTITYEIEEYEKDFKDN